MKTLYISDLDGTLLNKEVKLSRFSKTYINKLISKGVNFTIATARSPISVREVFADVDIKIPCILMNGVLCYDLKTQKFLNIKTVIESAFDSVMKFSRELMLTPFIYVAHNNALTTYYEDITAKPMLSFYNERKAKYGKSFIKVYRLEYIDKSGVIYFTYLNEYSKLKPLFDMVSSIEDISCAFYKDIYADDLWYLEIFSSRATKYNASLELKNAYNFDKLVCFGDSLNDVPLFKASDERYAVKNACNELKEIADYVIGTNEEDSVVKEILKLENEY